MASGVILRTSTTLPPQDIATTLVVRRRARPPRAISTRARGSEPRRPNRSQARGHGVRQGWGCPVGARREGARELGVRTYVRPEEKSPTQSPCPRANFTPLGGGPACKPQKKGVARPSKAASAAQKQPGVNTLYTRRESNPRRVEAAWQRRMIPFHHWCGWL